MKEGSNYCRLYLVRHGETDWNAQHLLQGHTDIGLNEQGEKQAHVLRGELKDVVFDAAFSSDLLRAKRTAEIVLMQRNLAVQTTEVLRERNYGRFEGKSTELVKEQLWRVQEKLAEEERAAHKPYEDVENDNEMMTRLLPFLREVAVAYPDKSVLISTHAGILRSLLYELGHSPRKIFLKIQNTAYAKILSDGVDFIVDSVKGIAKRDDKIT